MITYRIHLCFTLLILTLFFSSCKKLFAPVVVIPGENLVIITKTSGCHISNGSDPNLKDATVRVSAGQDLEFESSGQDSQVSFPNGSPLAEPDPLIHEGSTPSSHKIRLVTKICAEIAGTFGRSCDYDFTVYDAHDPQKVNCDPTVHVTK